MRWLTALSLAQRAIEQDRRDPWGHFVAGYVHTYSAPLQAGRRGTARGHRVESEFYECAHDPGAHLRLWRPARRSLAELAIATRLNPRDQRHQNAIILSITGLCHLMAKRFGEAVEFERRAVQVRRPSGPPGAPSRPRPASPEISRSPLPPWPRRSVSSPASRWNGWKNIIRLSAPRIGQPIWKVCRRLDFADDAAGGIFRVSRSAAGQSCWFRSSFSGVALEPRPPVLPWQAWMSRFAACAAAAT